MSYLRSVGGASVAFLLMASPTLAQEAPPEGTPAVYLSMAEILQSLPAFAEATRTFNRDIAERKTELTEQAAVVDSLLRDYQQQEQLLSPQAKEDKQEEIRSRQQALQQRQIEMEDELDQRQQELMGPITEKVGGVIEAIRSERSYAMVFDMSTQGLIAADESLNITELVKARLVDSDATATTEP